MPKSLILMLMLISAPSAELLSAGEAARLPCRESLQSDSESFSSFLKNNDFLWAIGFVKPQFASFGDGRNVGYCAGVIIEKGNFQYSVDLQYAQAGKNSIASYFVSASWLPIPGAISPYFGLGLGFSSRKIQGVDLGGDSISDISLRPTIGLELLRKEDLRIQIGADMVVPFFKHTKTEFVVNKSPTNQGVSVEPKSYQDESYYPTLHLKVIF